MADLARAVQLLRAGRLVAFPTETVYGLGANALDPAAVQRIFEAKGRPLTSPLIVHVPDLVMARTLVCSWPEPAQALAERFWPGPLTIILPKDPVIPDVVTAGLPNVGIRIPAHPLARGLLQAVQIPLAAPSANRFTQISPTTAEHVREGLGDRVDFILDGGPCTVGIESTVLSLAGNVPKILRPGMISATHIEQVIGPVESGSGADSPGQHPKHYSPRTRVVLGDVPPTAGRGVVLNRGRMPEDPGAYAEVLYARLHALDTQELDWVSIEMPPDTPEWAGIRDRLMRAAG